MFTGLYPLVPHACARCDGAIRGSARCARRSPSGAWRSALSAARPAGFLPLPGAQARAAADHRAARLRDEPRELRAARVSARARRARADLRLRVLDARPHRRRRRASSAGSSTRCAPRPAPRRSTSIGHSMGGVVARYYVALAGGDGVVANLVTLGSPHAGTDVSAVGIGHPTRELLARLEAARSGSPRRRRRRTRSCTTIWSRADALVPARAASRRRRAPSASIYDDLGHVALLGSRRVARAIIERLRAAFARARR